MKSNRKSLSSVSSAKVRSIKIAEFLKEKGFEIKHSHALELLSISHGFDSWNHYSAALHSEDERSSKNYPVTNEVNKHLSHSVEENSIEQNKKDEGQNRLIILEKIVKKEYPHAKIIPHEQLGKRESSSKIEAIDVSNKRKNGIVKSVTAEQVIKKWSNPEYIRKMYGEKERSNIASVVIEHHGRRQTLVIDLEVERVIGISG